MENSFQTSFIPKKPIVSSITSDKKSRSLLSFVPALLLVFSILASSGLFVYKIYLTKQKESASNSLSVIRDSFEKGTIEQLELFNKRTEAAKKILNKHVILTPVFALLGDITIPAVQYTNFMETNDDKGYAINIEGLARDYRSIALQADMFNNVKGNSFNNVLFSNLVKDKDNNITFDLKFYVEPSLLSYEKSVLLEQENSNTTSSPLPGDVRNTTQ